MEPLDKAKLIQIARRKLKDTKKIKANSDVELVNKFIIAENIKAHETCLVPGVLIYDKYEAWARSNNLKVIQYKYFFTVLIKFFNRKISGPVTAYFISTDGFNLSPAYVDSIKKKWISINEKKQQKKNKKE